MPITFILVGLGFLGLLLFVPAVPISVVLLAARKKLAALIVFCIPCGVIVLSIALIAMVFAAAKLHSFTMSARPNRLFAVTFGFKPPPQTSVLEAQHRSVMDHGTTAMKFQTTPDVIERIVARGFVPGDRDSFMRMLRSNDLPQHIQRWFLPEVQQTDHFYVTKAFERSFAISEAVLCYNEKTGIACFHWVGMD